MIKVLHLNASTEGGASGAAQRLHEALSSSKRVVSKHLIFSGKKINDSHTRVMYSSRLGRLFTFAFHALDKLDFLRYERDKTIRFQFSHAKVGIDITSHKWFKEADIIHLHWIHKGFLSYRSLKSIMSSGKQIVWTMHDMWAVTGGCYHVWGCDHFMHGCGNCQYLRKPHASDLSYKKYQEKQSIWDQSGISFVAPSKWMLGIAMQSRLMKNANYSVQIPNHVDTDFYCETFVKSKHTDRQGLKLDPHKFTVLFAAAFLPNPQKGFDRFIELYRIIQSRMNNVQALIIGDSKGEDYELADAQFLGYISDPKQIINAYSLSDLFVITSVQDNLPGTVLESMSCGTPVAGFNIGGIPEMIDDNKNGFVAEPEKLDDLANRIIDYINSPEKHAHFSQNARKKILENYHKDIVVDKHVELYNSIMKNPE